MAAGVVSPLGNCLGGILFALADSDRIGHGIFRVMCTLPGVAYVQPILWFAHCREPTVWGYDGYTKIIGTALGVNVIWHVRYEQLPKEYV